MTKAKPVEAQTLPAPTPSIPMIRPDDRCGYVVQVEEGRVDEFKADGWIIKED